MTDIKSMTIDELKKLMTTLGDKPFRAKQIYSWLHEHLVTSYDEMTNLSKSLREKLKEYPVTALKMVDVQTSRIDGTQKYLFRLSDGNVIESVLMRYKHGNSVCISSQVGCRMGCRFCASTIGGLTRCLLPSEMLDQIYRIQALTGERVSNVVVMGTGEPLDNYENLLRFIHILTEEGGLHISQRNLTVSTCGLVPKIYDLAKEKLQMTLALSLHAPNDVKRRELMPIASKYSMDEALTNEITDYLQKDIIMDFTGYEERSYSERIDREDGSRIDIAACARKDAPGMVAIYYYTSPEFVRNYTLTIQNLLNGYSTQKDGTIIVADKGTIVASNDESLLGQDTAGNQVVQAMKEHTDSQHIFHLKNEGTRCYGIMLKQRDYYIYAYLPDTEVFRNLPLSVTAVVFLYLLIFGIFCFWGYRADLAHRKQEQEKDEKYKAELLRTAKKAEAANEAKTEFLQRMSHDIRTPINGICGMINVADYYADNMEKQTECRAKIKEASHLLLELINEVLDMSKLESDEVVLEEIPFNLNSISEEILGVIEHMATEQNIRIIWEEKEVTHWNLIGSPVHVKRILMNILSNAVKYNKENGYVYISCREIPSKQTAMTTLEFVCRDTGIGMTEAFQKRIFEPFAQEHAGSRTKFAGTGLGMPITKKLVEKMSGTISFESKEGTGTTFVIRIPFRIDTDMKDRTEAEEKTETSIHGLHVLLTEDNELNMEIAEFVLQNEGAVVTKAWNGQKAVDIFRKNRPGEFDAILMDIMMPVMNGYEAAKMIRSLDREDAKSDTDHCHDSKTRSLRTK